jgi:hypothetical protein
MARPDSLGDRRGDQWVLRKPSSRGLTMAALALLLPLGALTACGGGEEDGAATGGVPAPASGATAAAPAAAPAAVPAVALAAAPAAPSPALLGTTSGFTPLPSPQQVIEPLGKGRQDPFAPLTQGGPVTPSLPNGFLFTGVIQSRGLTQAIIQLGGSTPGAVNAGPSGAPSAAVAPSGPTSATLCVGPRGLCPGASPSDYQLPPGWSVTGIDLRQGLLSLRQGGLPLRLPLGAGRGAAPGQAVGSANPGPVNPASANPASAANSPVAAAPTAAGQAAGPAQTPSGR